MLSAVRIVIYMSRRKNNPQMSSVRVYNVDERRVARIKDLIQGLYVRPFVQRSRRIQPRYPVDCLIHVVLEPVSCERGDLRSHAVAYHVNLRHDDAG